MNSIANSSDKNPELVSPVQSLLFDAQYHRTEILIIGEVIPVLGPVEILLVGLLLDVGQLESFILLPLFLDSCLLPRNLVGVHLILLIETVIVVRGVSALVLVPQRDGRDLLPRTFDPVAGRWLQIVRELVTDLLCNEDWREPHVIIVSPGLIR